MQKQQYKDFTTCPVEATLNLVKGKWKVVIMFRLIDENRRFNELSRLLPKVTQRVLTNQLRELEKDGLVHRDDFCRSTSPSRIFSYKAC